MTDDVLPGGIDPDRLTDLYETHDGTITEIAETLSHDWHTVDRACIELGLKDDRPASATDRLAELEASEVVEE